LAPPAPTQSSGALDAFVSIVLSPKSRLSFDEMLESVAKSSIPVVMVYGKEDPWVRRAWPSGRTRCTEGVHCRGLDPRAP
jgi:hypothetical protein